MGAPIPSIIGPVRIRSRFTGLAGPPPDLASGEVAYNGVEDIVYLGFGNDGTGLATAVLQVAGKGVMLTKAMLGAANGVATLGADGKVPLSQLAASILGAMQYQGTWDASANSPALASGQGKKGFFYKVSVAGTTNLDGNAVWRAGDLVAFNGTTWDAIDGSTSEVQAINGRTGIVTLAAADILDSTAAGRSILTSPNVAAIRALLKLDAVQLVNDADAAITASMRTVAWTTLTAQRLANLPAVSAVNPGQRLRVCDMTGQASGSVSIVITPAGTDKIVNAANLSLTVPYQSAELEAVGSGWSVIAVYPPFPTSTATGVNAGQY